MQALSISKPRPETPSSLQKTCADPNARYQEMANLNLKQMHMQSMLRKRRNEAAQIQNIPSKAYPEIARTPVVTFVGPNVSYSLPKCLTSPRLYSSEVKEVV